MFLSSALSLVLLPRSTFMVSHRYPVIIMTGEFCSSHAFGTRDSNLITFPFEVKEMKA